MPKVVDTPSGKVTVLTETEFDEYISSLRRPEDEPLRCEKCNKELVSKWIRHPVFTDDKSASLDYSDASETAVYVVWYCVRCEIVPNKTGLPIVMSGSYHNRPY